MLYSKQKILPIQDDKEHVFGIEEISFRSAKDALPATTFLGRKTTEILNKLESLLFTLNF